MMPPIREVRTCVEIRVGGTKIHLGERTEARGRKQKKIKVQDNKITKYFGIPGGMKVMIV